MKRYVVRIPNELGLHMRAANVLAEQAGRYQSRIQISRGELRVNGKSIMGLMMLAAGKGSAVTFSATGGDAAAMLDELEQLFARKFDET